MGLPNIGPLELIIILAIALLIVGPGKLPEMGSAFGRTIREFRKAASDMGEATKLEAKPAEIAAPKANVLSEASSAPAADTVSTPAAAAPAAAVAAPAAAPAATGQESTPRGTPADPAEETA